jgi:hypothetical protein
MTLTQILCNVILRVKCVFKPLFLLSAGCLYPKGLRPWPTAGGQVDGVANRRPRSERHGKLYLTTYRVSYKNLTSVFLSLS